MDEEQTGPIDIPSVLTEGRRPCVCPRSMEYLTEEEEIILSRMRELTKEAREVKTRIKGLDRALTDFEHGQRRLSSGGDPESMASTIGRISQEKEECKRILEGLREERKALEGRLKEANRRKLIMLGHISGEE